MSTDPIPSVNQRPLILKHGARSDTLAMLYQVFGDVLIPLEQLRQRYFRNLNEDIFRKQIGTDRIPIPVVMLDKSNKALKYVEIHQLAIYVDNCAEQAEQQLNEKTEGE